jgi:hypothetical protein
MPVRGGAFKKKDWERRAAILEKQRYGSGSKTALSEGEGYEPPSGHLMPFSTRQPFRAIFDPVN